MFGKKKENSGSLVVQEREYILDANTDFFIRESYNALRSNITFSLTVKGCKVISVTSANPHEGKSITSLNLAISYSEIGKKVLLVDFDLRKPKVHRLLRLAPSPGVSNVLINECSIEDAIKNVEKYNIDVITSGDIPPNSTQLLESEMLEELLETVKKKYDYVILDTPPVDVVIDGCIIAKYISGVVFVVKQNYSKRDEVVNAVKQLEFSQGKILGFVLNDITDKKLLNFNYGYKYKKYKYGKYGYKNGYRYEYKSHSTQSSTSQTAQPAAAQTAQTPSVTQSPARPKSTNK